MDGNWATALHLQGTIYPVNLELIVRGIFHSNPDNKSVYFNAKYVEEAVDVLQGTGRHVQHPGGFSARREQSRKQRSMTPFATPRSPPRRKAKKRSASSSSP